VVSKTNVSSRAFVARPDQLRFYKIRQRVSMGLLLFVVIAGLPMVAVPSLRNRLSSRVLTLKTAMAGDVKPATLDVGANHEPFPAEYERPEPQLPKFPELPKSPETALTSPAGRPRTGSARARIDAVPQSASVTAEPADQDAEETEETAASAEPELKYQKGIAEQEAYDLLLKSNKTVAGMVQGNDPSLKFKSWDAASRGEDIYWVRLKFQSGANPDEEYIWQVKLQSSEVTPLSHNARSVS
jgi:hypothetical protein